MEIISIKEAGDHAKLYTPYNTEFIASIKQIEGRKWDSYEKCWTVPMDRLEEAKEILKRVFGYSGLDASNEIKKTYFSPVYPSFGDGIPFKGDVYRENDKVYLCTYMHYDDDMETATVRAIDITDTERGQDVLKKEAINAERKSILKELLEMKIDGTRSGGYEFKEEWSDEDARILYRKWDYSEYEIFIKDEYLCIRHTFYGGDTSYSFEKRPVAECKEIIKRIEYLVQRLEDLNEK